MRIVFLAVEDEFSGAMQAPLYDIHPDWVVGSVISKNAIYKKSKLQAGIFVIRKSGLVFLAEMFRMKILRRMGTKLPKPSPTQLAEQHGVEVFHSGDINDAESLATLERWQPDLVISTNFSHYIGKKARAVARVGTWNLHKSYLPHYRGMAPSFFALLQGADHVGSTLHVVTKGFDTGDVLDQVKVPITPDDSVYSLNRNTAAAGGKMMAGYLDRLDLDNVIATPQPPGDWPNHTYPTPAEVRRFRAAGLSF